MMQQVSSEFNVPGYNILSNDLSCNSKGIIIYMSQDLACKLVNVNVDFSEFFLLEVTGGVYIIIRAYLLE